MEPLEIVLIVLAVAAIWAAIELALTLRRARGTVTAVDRTLDDVRPVIDHIDATVGSAEPLVKKLETTVDEIKPVIDRVNDTLDGVQPALAQIEPLLKQGSIAVEALSADLIEVNGVLRDISDVTAGMSSASNAVSGVANAASEKVQKLFGKKDHAVPAGERTLADQSQSVTESPSMPPQTDEGDSSERSGIPQYYTYADSDDPAALETPSPEDSHE